MSVLVGGRAGVHERLVARRSGGGWRLSGKATAVMFAAEADLWLVAAQDADSGEIVILRVRREDAQARIEPFRLLDGRRAADVQFADVSLPGASVWLAGATAVGALERAGSHATSAYCADAVGCMTQLVSQTGEYLRTRVQFGVSLATFQALQHRFADMHMALMESSAIARALAHSLDEDAPLRQSWLRFAAPTVITAAGRKIGHEAIQMHGGMGLTDELIISHYNARLATGARLMRDTVPPDVTLPQLSSARAWL
jgi:alkylation response protein AidB-like acyl-CoA dehydrogenase